ncbi:hypothetical protein HBI21_021580 [Parastagonospora nodorum]|nr:hypothetical protein HBI21_021580 [Parastagonospora nodorum]
MSQTNVREEYRITTLEVVKLIEDLIIKTEDLSNTPTPTLSKTAQRQSSSVVSNRSTALITNKFSVASLTKPAILNNANIALVDAVHHSVVKQFSIFRLMTKESQQKLEENYFEVIDALTITLIKDDDNLLGTVNSYIKLRRLRAVMLLCQTTKLLGDSNKDGPPLKRRKTEAADSRHAKASRRRTKKDKDLEDSNTSSDVPRPRRRDRAAARAQLAKRKQLGKKAQLKKTRDEEELAKAKKEKEEKEAQERETYSLDINSKDNLEDEEATTAKDLAREQKERLKALLNANNPLALQFCFFSNSPPENIDRLTKEEAIEMQINTTNAISKALAAANKLTIPKANTPAVHPKATKHRLAPLAAQFIIVCSFRKVDKHVFRAYNTISVTAQRTIIRKGGPYIEKRAILLPNFLSTVQNAKQQCRDILEKEGLNKSEASRRVIFNRFKMQAIASYSALTTLKAAQFKTYGSRKVKRFTLNSVKDLFTNLSKDYFLSIAAEDAAKAANTPLLLKEVRAKILIESYKLIVQAIIVASIAFAEAITLTEATHVLAEMYVSIIYFNLDSELELKVLGKQNVKTTS